MSENASTSGGCLCGAVRFTVDETVTEFSVCHCNTCRRWSGAPFMAVECGPDVHFEGDEHIARYQSSDWAERGFCKTCGSNLFYRLTGDGSYHMALGAFDDQDGFDMSLQFFIDEKPDGYTFANSCEALTGAEAIELYAPKD